MFFNVLVTVKNKDKTKTAFLSGSQQETLELLFHLEIAKIVV